MAIIAKRAATDDDFAERQVAEFENDLKRAQRITYEEWRSRPWYEKALEHTAAFFDPQL
jgi:cardiolipin synthase A/B